MSLALPSLRLLFANPLDPATSPFLDRVAVSPSGMRVRQYDTVFRSLRTTGLLDKIDCLYLLAAHAGQASRQNLLSSDYTLMAQNSPTFVVDRGWQGNGSSSYMNTGFNPAIAGSAKYSLNSAHLSIRSNNNARMNNPDIGVAISTRYAFIVPWQTSGNVCQGALNDSNGAATAAAPASTAGLFTISRTSSTAWSMYGGGFPLGSFSTSTTGLPNGSIYLLGINGTGQFATHQLSAASIGAGLSAADVANLNVIISTYLSSIGVP